MMEIYRKRQKRFALMLEAAALIIIALGMLHNFFVCLQSKPASHSVEVTLVAYTCLPYIILLFLVVLRINPRILLCSAIVLFVHDLIMYAGIVTSASSTAGIGYIFGPLYDLVLYMPAGLVVGVIIVLLKKEKIFPRKSKAKSGDSRLF